MAINPLQALGMLLEWTGFGATDVIELGKYLKERVKQVRAENYYEKYHGGMQRISQERQRITEFLYEYYKATSSSRTKAHIIRYSAGPGYSPRDLPLVTTPDYLLHLNRQFGVQSNFSDKATRYPSPTDKELADEVAHWQAANLKLWGGLLYTINSIHGTVNIDFRHVRFLVYRATVGSLPDELAVALATYGIEGLFKKRDSILPRRQKYLGSAETLLTFDTRICAGGALVLFAARTDDDDLALILQRRSFEVSDEPGMLTVIPKAFHEPLISPWEEYEVTSTIYRECYEELFGGEDKPGGRRYISSNFYLDLCPPVKELYEGQNQNHILQPLGIIWDLLRGAYHVAYCMYVYNPEWWKKYQHRIQVNWEVDENVEPATRASDPRYLHALMDRKDWAPEAYFAFIEGLRWLSQKDQRISYIRPSLPNLNITPIRPTSM